MQVAELELAALQAEAAAEEKAAELSKSLAQSEAAVSSLEAQLSDVQGALGKSADAPGASGGGGAAAAAPAAEGAAEGAAAAASEGGGGGGAETAGAAAAPSGAFAEEAAQLTSEIEKQLRSAGYKVGKAGGVAGAGAGGGGGGGAAEGGLPVRPALSRMKKADLVDECVERSLPSEGSVAELRAGLRVERKRDGLVSELLERGWSERQARGALSKVGWDVDAAIAKLQKKKKR